MAVAVTLQLLAVTWSPLCDLLSTEQLSLLTVAGLATLSAVPALVVAAGRVNGRRHHAPDPSE